MHVHPTRFDPNLELVALDATQKAARKEAAARVNKKLFQLASALDADYSPQALSAAGNEEHEQPERQAIQPVEKRSRQQQPEADGLDQHRFSTWV